MADMRVVYQIINFLILGGILFLVGRKAVTKMINSRKERISAEQEEAEAGTRRAERARGLLAQQEAENAEKLEKLKAEEEKRIRRIAEESSRRAERRAAELRASTDDAVAGEKLRSVSHIMRDTSAKLIPAVSALLSSEPYAGRFRKREPELLDAILPRIALTPGDRSYIMQYGVLYVTVQSAFRLDDGLVSKAEKSVSALVAEAGGKISFRYEVEEKLIGGLRIKVGDMVYDATLKNALYGLGVRLREYGTDGGLDPESLERSVRGILSERRDAVDVYQRGRVVSVSDGICWLDGLADIMYGELVEFENGEQGMILDIEEKLIGCVIFGDYRKIRQYSYVRRLSRMVGVPVGDELLGAVVGPLGEPLDGRDSLHCTESRPIEFPAPAIIDRQAVDTPLYTGIKAVDALVPIGRGQRELIIGDRQTGKSSIAVDAILNQKGKNVVCVYVVIGQKDTAVASLVELLRTSGAMEYTVVVVATASDSAPMQYIAPSAGTAIGEYFMYGGRDVLIVYDDLSKHAVAYREMSLLLHRPAGREAYPGDIFYLHSRLLERSAHLSAEKGGGSMTALPIVETQAGDNSAYIPTNIISITDGQIFLESELFNRGQRPAINAGLSVSRVGGSAQCAAMRQVSGRLRMELAQYRELESFAQFGADLDDRTGASLERGARTLRALCQPQHSPLPVEKQVLLLFALGEGFADGIPADRMREFENAMYVYFDTFRPGLMEEIATGRKMSAELMQELKDALAVFAEGYSCQTAAN